MAKTKMNPLEFFRKAAEDRVKKMRDGGPKTMLPKHQTKGQTSARQKALDKAYDNTYGSSWEDIKNNPERYQMTEETMRRMADRPQTNPTPFQNYLKDFKSKGATASDTTGMTNAIDSVGNKWGKEYVKSIYRKKGGSIKAKTKKKK